MGEKELAKELYETFRAQWTDFYITSTFLEWDDTESYIKDIWYMVADKALDILIPLVDTNTTNIKE